MDGNQDDRNTSYGANEHAANSLAKDLNSRLLKSVDKGDLKEVEKLLSEGADINTRGCVDTGHFIGEKTPLLLAVLRENLKLCKTLLRFQNIDVNKGDEYGYTALHAASSQGLAEIVEMLLEKKEIDVNAVYTKTGDRPLQFAAGRNHEEVAEKLLNVEGIMVNAKDNYARTSLHACAKAGNIEVMELLLNVPGILVNEKDDLHNHTPLHLAVDFSNLDEVEALLNHPDIDVNVKDKYGQTPLHTSAYHGNLRVVEMLLNAGINVQEKTNKGLTAVQWAAKQGNKNVVRMIVNHIKKADIPHVDAGATRKKVHDLTQYMKQIRTPRMDNDTKTNESNIQLLEAAKNGNLCKVEELLKYPGTDVNCKDRYFNNTPLHLASEEGHVGVVRALLNTPNIEVNVRKKDASKLAYPIHAGDDPARAKLKIGKTALHLAVENGHLEVVKELLSCPKTDVNAKDKYDDFPLYEAVEGNNVEIARILLNHPGIKVNAIQICSDHFTSLHSAVIRGNLEMAKTLLNHPDINVNLKDKFYKYTPLYLAIMEKKFEIADVILNHPTLEVKENDLSYQLFQFGVEKSYLEVLGWLFDASASANTNSMSAETPLAVVTERKHLLCINLLQGMEQSKALDILQKFKQKLGQNLKLNPVDLLFLQQIIEYKTQNT